MPRDDHCEADGLRPARAEDVPALGRLQRELDVAWWGREETDDTDVAHLLRWVGDLDARSRVLPGPEGIVGYAAVTAGGDATLAVAPGLPADRRRAALDALLAWLVASPAGAVLELDAPRQDLERLDALARHGLLPLRSQFDLERPANAPLATPAWPAGVDLVPFRDDLAPALHTLVYSVWADVPGHHWRPYDEWRHLFLHVEPFDPGLQVVAARDGAPVGVALSRVSAGTDGWVSQLAVARDEQGRGLGRALLLEALRRLASAGTDRVGLGVSARNAAALGLYRSAGLEIVRETAVCTPRGREAPPRAG